MNTEYRNKLYNRIKDVFEKEETQEQQAFLQARENFNERQKNTFDLARQVVERSYPSDDVATLRVFKKKYGDPCDVVAKDKCFYFAHAYYREELKEKGLNPDIIAQQQGKDSNPHKTKHVDANNKFIGHSSHRSNDEDGIGLNKQFDEQYKLDVIGTSHCRSRAIACTKNEYEIFCEWRSAKAKVVSTHQTWIDSIGKQTDQLKIGLKAYRYLSEGIELATELGIKVDEAELVRTNSTGLTIYNPSNLASMIKGMKNKNQTREDKIKARLQYEKQAIN